MPRRSRSALSRPRYTVVMPAHQSAATIDESIASVLAQTVADFELLVIENGSIDDTLERARTWSARDPRVYVTALETGDVAAARNAGLAEARGDYVTFLDADDVYLPRFLEVLDSVVGEYPGRTMYALGGVRVEPGGKRTPATPGMRRDRPTGLDLATVAWMRLFPNQVAYPTEALRAIGGFRRCYIEDYDLWMRTFATGGTGIYVPAELSEHRVFTTSRSHDPAFYEESVDSAIASLRDALGHSLKDADRAAVQRRLDLLEHRRRHIHVRVGLERRLRAGDSSRARRDYLRAAPAYRSRARFAAGLLVMFVSPALFTRWTLTREVAR